MQKAYLSQAQRNDLEELRTRPFTYGSTSAVVVEAIFASKDITSHMLNVTGYTHFGLVRPHVSRNVSDEAYNIIKEGREEGRIYKLRATVSKNFTNHIASGSNIPYVYSKFPKYADLVDTTKQNEIAEAEAALRTGRMGIMFTSNDHFDALVPKRIADLYE
eukprot:2517466-Pleurochrysis_carterae.AAC.2